MDNGSADGTQRTVIFVHLPKTAGSTVNHILYRMYDERQICQITKEVDGANGHGWTSLNSNPSRRSRFKSQKKSLRVTIPELQELPAARRAQIKLLMGYQSFGLHDFLPNPCTYMTLLRDPVDRVISHYYYVLRMPTHPLHNRVKSLNMSLEEYVESGIATDLDNDQLRRLAAVGGKDNIAFGQCSRELLLRGIDNLNTHFAVVGLTERFDESVILMKRALSWRAFPYYIRRNLTKKRTAVTDIPKRTIRVIERCNQFDCELYEYVRRNFDKAVEENGIADEVKRFKSLNTIYRQCNLKDVYVLPALRAFKRELKRVPQMIS